MSMNDIIGLGKVLPIDKLLDILSGITTRLSKPYFDRKDIDTKAYEIKKLAEARAEEVKIISMAIKENYEFTGGIDYKENSIGITSPKELPISNTEHSVLINPSLEERAKDRLNLQEAKKQLNLESVTAYAAEELKNQPLVTDEPVDEDWKTRFFNIAEDISSDEMQALWGRILAGEIKQPKSYSLRTLELLKNLSKDEAEVFTKFAKIKIVCGDKSIIYNQDNGDFLEREFGITFTDRLLLTELGLISSQNKLEFHFDQTNQTATTDLLFIGAKVIVLKRGINTPKQGVKCLVFTKTGAELSKLIEPIPNENYIKKICSSFKHQNVKIEYGNFVHSPDGKIEVLNRIEYTEP